MTALNECGFGGQGQLWVLRKENQGRSYQDVVTATFLALTAFSFRNSLAVLLSTEPVGTLFAED